MGLAKNPGLVQCDVILGKVMSALRNNELEQTYTLIILQLPNIYMDYIYIGGFPKLVIYNNVQ